MGFIAGLIIAWGVGLCISVLMLTLMIASKEK